VDIIIPLAILVVAFYLLIIRPQRTRARAAAQLQSRLAPGVQVMTTSGMYGTVSSIEDDVVLLEVSPGTTVRWAKPAIGRILAEDTTGDGPADASRDQTVQLPADDDADSGTRKTSGE
jgi:preprotein translocase subunit YajC